MFSVEEPVAGADTGVGVFVDTPRVDNNADNCLFHSEMYFSLSCLDNVFLLLPLEGSKFKIPLLLV